MLKDYYTILQLPSHATLAEIRQAYRRLAMMYHPDKNPDDPYAQAQFSNIKEAYEVLTNPVKKEIYLQERWYNQSMGKKGAAGTITPVSILKLSLELEQYVFTLDVHRMNKEGLFDYMQQLVSEDTIERLKQFDEKGVNRQIITTMLAAMKPLPLKFIKLLSERLERFGGSDKESLQRIRNSLLKHKKAFLWEKYKIAVMLLFTILICLLIYFTSK